MKKMVAALMLLAGGLMAAPRVTVGVGIGFGAPAPVAVVRPACPGPGYTWVDGYYAPNGAWIAGYWTAPVAPAVVRVAPPIAHERIVVHRDFDHRYDRFRR